MSYKISTVHDFVQKNFKSQAEFCRAIGVHAQQYRDYESHLVLIDRSGREKPFLFLKRKEVNIGTP